MSNLEYWDKMSKPPKEALKNIKGGRLKGMTDISPQWRLKIMTETFGPIGIGWYYDIDKTWTEKTDDGQSSVYVIVKLYIILEERSSFPIYGIGGSMLNTLESKGLYHSDEGFKMALTDALSVAMKQLGVGSEIYEGKWDGSKYITDNKLSEEKKLEIYAKIKETIESAKNESELKLSGNLIRDHKDVFTQTELNGLIGIGKQKAQELNNE